MCPRCELKIKNYKRNVVELTSYTLNRRRAIDHESFQMRFMRCIHESTVSNLVFVLFFFSPSATVVEYPVAKGVKEKCMMGELAAGGRKNGPQVHSLHTHTHTIYYNIRVRIILRYCGVQGLCNLIYSLPPSSSMRRKTDERKKKYRLRRYFFQNSNYFFA